MVQIINFVTDIWKRFVKYDTGKMIQAFGRVEEEIIKWINNKT